MSGLPQPIQDAVNGLDAGVQTAQRGFNLFGTIFQIILWGIPLMLGAGWLFGGPLRDQEWAGGIRDFLAPIAQSLVDFMPFLRPILGNLADAAPAGSTVAMAANLGVITPEMRDAITRPTQVAADGATLDRALAAARTRSGAAAAAGLGRGNLAAAFVNEHVIAALLSDTTPDAADPTRKAGQAMILRVLAVPQPAPTATTAGQTPATPAANPALQAVRAFLNNSTLFNQTMTAEGAWDTLYTAAQTAGNITINTDARTALNTISSETRRQLFVALVPENGAPNTAQITQAFGQIVNDTSVTNETLFTVLSNITSTNADITSNINRLIVPAGATEPSLEHFTTLRTNIQVLGAPLMEEFAAPNANHIAILEREIRREGSPLNPATPVAEGQPSVAQRFASLASLAPTATLGSLRITEQNAGAVMQLMVDLEPGTLRAFTNATQALAQPVPTQPAANAAEAERTAYAAAQRTRAEALRTVTSFALNPVVREFITANPTVLPENLQGVTGMLAIAPTTQAGITAAANIVATASPYFNEEEQAEFLQGIRAAMSGEQRDYSTLVRFLFDDTKRDGLFGEDSEIAPTLRANILAIASENRAGMSYEERTIRALLTGDGNPDASTTAGNFARLDANRVGTHNIEKIIGLIHAIDGATGGTPGSAEETDADALNARVTNVLMRLASGQRITEAELRERSPGANGTTLMQDLRRLMNNETVVNAFKAFLGEVDTDNMTPAQQALVRALEADFWHDTVKTGEMDALTGTFSWDDDKGLAPALAGGDDLILKIFGIDSGYFVLFDDLRLGAIQRTADAARTEHTAYNLARGITGGDTVAGSSSPEPLRRGNAVYDPAAGR
jgi:hypothetical protein